MTFVGKVLVVVNVVLTMCIAMFAGGVFTVQQNWKKSYETKTQELNNNLNAERDALAKEKDKTKKLTADLADMTQAKNRFEGAANNATVTLNNRIQENGRIKLLSDKLQNTNAQQDKDLKIKEEELKGLRTALAQVHASLKTLRTNVTALEDKKYELEREKQRMIKKHDDVLELLAAYRKMVLANGLKDEPEKFANVELKPIPSDGVVEDVLPGGRDKSTLVKISNGSDDGIRKDTVLFVFRLADKGKYLGKIKIIDVKADTAVGEVIDDPKNGMIQKGDNVSPKI